MAVVGIDHRDGCEDRGHGGRLFDHCYLEALLVFVLIEEDAVVPVVLVPASCIVGAQYLAIRKPVRLLVADAQGQPPPQLPSRLQPADAGVAVSFGGARDVEIAHRRVIKSVDPTVPFKHLFND